MPKVGKGQKAVEYPYSKKGVTDAIAHSKRTGEPVSMEYRGGGMIPKYNLGGMVPRRPIAGARPGMGRGINPRVLQALASRFKKGGKVKK